LLSGTRCEIRGARTKWQSCLAVWSHSYVGTVGCAQAPPPMKPPPGGEATDAVTFPEGFNKFWPDSKVITAAVSVLAPPYPGSLTVEPLRCRRWMLEPPLGGVLVRSTLLVLISAQTAFVPAVSAPKLPTTRAESLRPGWTQHCLSL
jgi:hypothetical protein